MKKLINKASESIFKNLFQREKTKNERLKQELEAANEKLKTVNEFVRLQHVAIGKEVDFLSARATVGDKRTQAKIELLYRYYEDFNLLKQIIS